MGENSSTKLNPLPFFEGLPVGEESSSRLTPGVWASKATPSPVTNPQILCWSESLASQFRFVDSKQSNLSSLLSGNTLFENSQPIATRYGGHQFGHWAGQLGDGRAMLLGQALSNQDSAWEVQLKGSGPTAYSRRGDGRAVLRSSLREYLCSEAMHFLGVPTTRALALVTTGDTVIRDILYDGNPAPEPGAIVTRMAPSFLRFGHLELYAAEDEAKLLNACLLYLARQHYPHLGTDKNFAKALFREICENTAKLICQWQSVGFVHGVLNTDNMSLLGLTIDYGPYGWLEDFDPNFTPNTSDQSRRYAYSEQPRIALWNLNRLAVAFAKAGVEVEDLKQSLLFFQEIFEKSSVELWSNKLGFDKIGPDEYELLNSMPEALFRAKADFTIFYRNLSLAENGWSTNDWRNSLQRSCDKPEAIIDWCILYSKRVTRTDHAARKERMNSLNPVFILRNHLVQTALDELEKGNEQSLRQLEQAIQKPFDENDLTAKYFAKQPDWAKKRPGCGALSCSS